MAKSNADTVFYNFIGLNKEINAINNTLKIPFTDSANGGYWRTMRLQKNNAVLQFPTMMLTGTQVIPNVIGMGLKDAVYLTENKGLKIIITGRGKVINQSLAAGTTFKKGETLTIFLN